MYFVSVLRNKETHKAMGFISCQIQSDRKFGLVQAHRVAKPLRGTGWALKFGLHCVNFVMRKYPQVIKSYVIGYIIIGYGYIFRF